MDQRAMKIVIYAVIGLAIIGIIGQLIKQPISFLTSLLMMIGLGVAIFAVVYFLFIRQRTPNDMKKYKQAVKQSRSKYNQQAMSRSFPKKAKQPARNKKFRKRPTHLRVIDGHKSKKKTSL